MTIHYDDNGPRCGKGSEVTSKKSAVTCASCRKMMKKRVNYMAQADRLFSQRIKERDGACVRCGSVEFLQCAHILSRSYKAIRTDERNAVTLCRSCHVYFTHRPLEWEQWVRESFGGLWDELRAKALTYEKVDWRAEVVRLS